MHAVATHPLRAATAPSQPKDNATVQDEKEARTGREVHTSMNPVIMNDLAGDNANSFAFWTKR